MANGLEENYQTSFDGDFYLKTYYSDVQSADGTTEFIMGFYHQVFQKGEITGKTLLDIGTGPAICYIIEQCLKFDHVYLSDLPEVNREALHSWFNDHSFHDYTPFFKFVADKYSDGRTVEEIRNEVVRKLRGILPCDIRDSHPLRPCYFPQFDVITSTLCLHAAAETLDEYRDVVRNVFRLLNPGGWAIELGHLGETFYKVRDTRYDVLCFNKEDVCRIWEEEGFSLHSWEEYTPVTQERLKYTDWECIFCLVARKKQTSNK